jgi:hypothetical protein
LIEPLPFSLIFYLNQKCFCSSWIRPIFLLPQAGPRVISFTLIPEPPSVRVLIPCSPNHRPPLLLSRVGSRRTPPPPLLFHESPEPAPTSSPFPPLSSTKKAPSTHPLHLHLFMQAWLPKNALTRPPPFTIATCPPLVVEEPSIIRI